VLEVKHTHYHYSRCKVSTNYSILQFTTCSSRIRTNYAESLKH